MMTYTLTILDVSGVQNYLFDSNRLTHNIGASYLVEQAMDVWVKDAARDWQAGNIESGAANYEIVYSGGGNAVLLFDSRDRAIEFTRRYTKHLLTDAPGLRVVVQHTDLEWSQSLAAVYTQALRELAKKKAEQTPVMPMLGLGVTAACQYTGLPAVDPETDPAGEQRRVSAQVHAKLAVRDKARERLKKKFSHLLDGYEFVDDFNLFGERGKASYIAVVHADGNGMGKRKEAICQDPENQNNRRFIQTLRKFSEEVNQAGTQAIQETFARLMKWVEAEEERRNDFIAWDEQKKVHRGVKFVPLVFGGDDVTFVCDGRLGLSLAAVFLQEFNKQRLEVDGKSLYACAGVAIVKNRYPFARAYDMAEDLCKSAKRAVKKWRVTDEEDALALDWHFAVSGAVLSLDEIRKREYTVKDGKLYVRPYLINAPREPLKSWRAFRHAVREFNEGKDWKDRRNKVKELREQLRQGQDATKQFRELFELPQLPDIGVSDCREGGWSNSTCAYFDAIEAMDLFLDMEENV
jgi:hypothetical protein